MEEDNVDEWELLPKIHDEDDDDGVNKIFSRIYGTDHNHAFVTNYFVFPSVRSSLNHAYPTMEVNRQHRQILRLPIDVESPADQISEVELELELPDNDLGGGKPDDETVSHVPFVKLLGRENEFADMKLDSPKSISSGSRTVLPQIDLGALIQYELDDANEIHNIKDDKKSDHQKNSGGGGLTSRKWNLNLTGTGVICSIGVVVAATFSFIVFGIQRKNNREESKLRFQIFTNEKVLHKNSISMLAEAHITL